MGSADLGLLRTEIRRIGEEVREGIAELRVDVKDAVTELREAIDDRKDEITELRIALAKAPTAETIAVIQAEAKKQGEAIASMGTKLAMAGAGFIGLIEAVVHVVFK